jgi:hypothetical protein
MYCYYIIMTKLQILLLIVVLVFIYNFLVGGVRENVGSDWFHRGKLADIHTHIQKQVAKYRANKKEDFSLHELDNNYKSELKIKMKDISTEVYEPNRYVISDYSFKALKPITEVSIDSPELDTIQGTELAADDFARPQDYTDGKPLAEHLEVSKYNAGSGDLGKLNKVFDQQNREKYIATTNALSIRGGNVALYKRKKCSPPEGDIIGFQGY